MSLSRLGPLKTFGGMILDGYDVMTPIYSLYNSMQDVTTIPTNCDYFFMKEGVKPMWEDPANKGGSDIRVTVSRTMNTPLMWKMTLLMAVGCQLTDYQHLTGVQFAYRGNRSRISVWLGPTPPDTLERIKYRYINGFPN